MSGKKYKEADLEAAVIEVRRGAISKKAASIKYKVPRSTIQFRLSNKFVKKEKGPETILSKEEEGVLVKWVNECCRKGFPRRKEDILISVKEFLDINNRKTLFKDNYPGRGWYRAFLRRHPEVVPRKPEAVTNASSCVNKSNIKSWFVEIESVLKNEGSFDILKDPKRVFNGDETNFLLCPNNSTVLAPKGTKNVYEIEQGKSKSAVTVMFTFSTSGKVVPPMIIYPYKRIPSDVVRSVPSHWGIGHSDSGWMKAEVFYEYIGNVFNQYLIQNKVKLPVILFVDGHKTHLTYQLSQLCTELPDTPKRKGTRMIERAPFVVTSKKWKELFEEKDKKKKQEELAKAERKRKREETKKKTEENKMTKKAKKENAINKSKPTKSVMAKKIEKHSSLEFNEKSQTKTACVDQVTKKEKKKELTSAVIALDQAASPTPSLGKKCIKTNVSGLCYSCGRGFKAIDKAVECDMCDKVYHMKCAVNESGQIDKDDPVFICQPCIQLGDEILQNFYSKL